MSDRTSHSDFKKEFVFSYRTGSTRVLMRRSNSLLGPLLEMDNSTSHPRPQGRREESLSTLKRPVDGTTDGSKQATFYFVDGFHGGTWGHMPLGSWRDVIEALERHPEWRISLDIEPISWDELKRTDPYSYRKLSEYLKDRGTRPRVEMIAGSYAQPFAWAIGGESNIRHLIRGRELIQEHFPDILLDTYAVQEPCWTSSMPQILRSLGFRRAVLKNPTAWGGYAAGFDAEIVDWVGPDGSKIPTVPRYACEGLVACNAVESAGYQLRGRDGDETDMRAFVQKCVEHGILRPSGMCLQDLGWSARPWLDEEHVQYTTWREYVEEIVDKPTQEWRMSQEAILCTLPWGEAHLQRLAREVRQAEDRILIAEKLAALATVLCRAPYPKEALQEAWDRLLYAQHHDIWICATTREGRKNWAWQASASTYACEEICVRVISDSLEALAARDVSDGAGQSETDTTADTGDDASHAALQRGVVQRLHVVNTLGSPRKGLAQADAVLPLGTRGVRITSSDGAERPVQLIPKRKYPDGSITTATLLFEADAPGLGQSFYSCEALPDAPAKSPESDPSSRVSVVAGDDLLWIESDLYRIGIDIQRGGVISSLYHKQLDKEFCDRAAERAFNEYRGYFIAENRWRTSCEAPVEVEVIEEGPVRARVALRGRVGDHPFQTVISVTHGDPRIDFHVGFYFHDDTWIGDPWDIDPAKRRRERRRSHHDDRFKLLVSFPTAMQKPALYKDAPFDVCKSAHENTYFKSWDEIKHNIIHRWVDLYDESADVGLALFSNHTTSYVYGDDHPLSLTVAWGWEGGFWWGKRPLRGRQEIRYALIPHAQNWSAAEIPLRINEWSEPLLAFPAPGSPSSPRSLSTSLSAADGELSQPSSGESPFEVVSEGVEVVTLLVDGNDLLIRLFHARDKNGECALRLHVEPESVEFVELDGEKRPSSGTSGEPEATLQSVDGARLLRFALPPFGLRTLRLRGIALRPEIQES